MVLGLISSLTPPSCGFMCRLSHGPKRNSGIILLIQKRTYSLLGLPTQLCMRQVHQSQWRDGKVHLANRLGHPTRGVLCYHVSAALHPFMGWDNGDPLTHKPFEEFSGTHVTVRASPGWKGSVLHTTQSLEAEISWQHLSRFAGTILRFLLAAAVVTFLSTFLCTTYLYFETSRKDSVFPCQVFV